MKIKSLLILFLLTVCCVGNLFAQEENTQCEFFDKYKNSVSVDFINENLTNVLSYFNKQFDCEFINDKDINISPITEKFDNSSVVWVFYDILQKYNLAIVIKEKLDAKTNQKSNYIFISTKEKILSEINYSKKKYFSDKTLESDTLHTQFVKLNRLSLSRGVIDSGFFDGIIYKYPEEPKIIPLVEKLLSSRGVLEIDRRSHTFIIIDTKERLDIISKQIKLWDNSGISSEEILKDFESNNKEQK